MGSNARHILEDTCSRRGSTSLMAESMDVLETNGWDKSELVVGVYATNENE